MRAIIRMLAAGSLLATPASAAGTEGVLRLKCEWQKTTDMKTLQTRALTGSSEFIYDPISDLTGTMTKQGLDAPFVASTGDRLIQGIAHYVVDGAAAEQSVEINRYTGAILNLVRTPGESRADSGLCTRISGPSFGSSSDAP